MNKKLLLGIILVLTCFAVSIIILINASVRYNKLVINTDKWNSIIDNKNYSTNISLDKIEFNDYDLIIDNENGFIYYSMVDSSNKYNPSIKYETNQKVNIVINMNITDKVVEKNNYIKIMLYNDLEYRLYYLVATNYPTLNVTYTGEDNNKRKLNVKLDIFDNYIDSSIRVMKSDGELKTIEENKEYSLYLKKESLGHNERKNNMSIFGMEKRNEYLIKVTDSLVKNKKYVQFFINNEYKGLYSFESKEGRIDNFERNKEANK